MRKEERAMREDRRVRSSIQAPSLIFKNINGQVFLVYDGYQEYKAIGRMILGSAVESNDGWLALGYKILVSNFNKLKEIAINHSNELHSVETLYKKRVFKDVIPTHLIFDYDYPYDEQDIELVIRILNGVFGLPVFVYKTGSGNMRFVIKLREEPMNFEVFKKLYKYVYLIFSLLVYKISDNRLKPDLSFLKNISQGIFPGFVTGSKKEKPAILTIEVKGREFSLSEIYEVIRKEYSSKLKLQKFDKLLRYIEIDKLFDILSSAVDAPASLVLSGKDYRKKFNKFVEYFYDIIDQRIGFKEKGKIYNRKLFPVYSLMSNQIKEFVVVHLRYYHKDESKYVDSVYFKFETVLRQKFFEKYSDKVFTDEIEIKFGNLCKEFISYFIYLLKNSTNKKYRVADARKIIEGYFEFSGDEFDDPEKLEQYFAKIFSERGIKVSKKVFKNVSSVKREELFEEWLKNRVNRFKSERFKNIILPAAGIAKALDISFTKFEKYINDYLPDRSSPKNSKDCKYAWGMAKPAVSKKRFKRIEGDIIGFPEIAQYVVSTNREYYGVKREPRKYKSLRNIKNNGGNIENAKNREFVTLGELNLIYDAVIVDKPAERYNLFNSTDTSYFYTMTRRLLEAISDPIVYKKGFGSMYSSYNVFENLWVKYKHKIGEIVKYGFVNAVEFFSEKLIEFGEVFYSVYNALKEMYKKVMKKYYITGASETKRIIVKDPEIYSKLVFQIKRVLFDKKLNRYQLNYVNEVFHRVLDAILYVIDWAYETDKKLLNQKFDELIRKFYNDIVYRGNPDINEVIELNETGKLKKLHKLNPIIDYSDEFLRIFFKGNRLFVYPKHIRRVMTALRRAGILPKRKPKKISWLKYNIGIVYNTIYDITDTMDLHFAIFEKYLSVAPKLLRKLKNTYIAFAHFANYYAKPIEPTEPDIPDDYSKITVEGW